MTTFNSAEILANGAVLTKHGTVVELELEGEFGLFFCTNEGGVLDTDRAQFDTRQDRDEALLRTVVPGVEYGWTLAGGEG